MPVCQICEYFQKAVIIISNERRFAPHTCAEKKYCLTRSAQKLKLFIIFVRNCRTLFFQVIRRRSDGTNDSMCRKPVIAFHSFMRMGICVSFFFVTACRLPVIKFLNLWSNHRFWRRRNTSNTRFLMVRSEDLVHLLQVLSDSPLSLCPASSL